MTAQSVKGRDWQPRPHDKPQKDGYRSVLSRRSSGEILHQAIQSLKGDLSKLKQESREGANAKRQR